MIDAHIGLLNSGLGDPKIFALRLSVGHLVGTLLPYPRSCNYFDVLRS